MKKIITFLLIMCFILTFLSCVSDDSTSITPAPSSSSTEHQHTYANEWTSTKEGHYKACTCHPEIVDITSHRDSVNRDGSCDVCHYIVKEPTTFTVTVKDSNGAALQGITVKIFTNSYDKTVTTDKNGTATCEFVYYDDVKAIIQNAPEEYEHLIDQLYTFEDNSLVIEAQ